MDKRAWLGGVAPLLLLAACERADPPSERLERAAEELVAEAEGETLPARQQEGPYAPRDECKGAAGLAAFMAELRSAIEARDSTALAALAADDIKLDFGGGAGKAELRQRLDEQDGRLWEELDELLTLGCASDGEARLALPWYWNQNVPGDAFETYIVTGEKIRLHNAPGDDAPVLARISWDAVEMVQDAGDFPDFRHVRFTRPGGDVVDGYVAQERLRSVIDYRLLAARRNGKWRVVSLVAGD